MPSEFRATLKLVLLLVGGAQQGKAMASAEVSRLWLALVLARHEVSRPEQ